MAVGEEFASNAFFCAASEEYAVGEDDRHGAFWFEVVEAVEEEGEVGGGFGGEAVTFESYVFADGFGGFPAIAEGRIGDDRIEVESFGGVGFFEDVPVVGEGVAVEDLEF